MTSTAYKYNAYNVGHMFPTKYTAPRCAMNSLTEKLDKHQEQLYANRKTAEDSEVFPLYIPQEGSTMSDEYYSGSELMSWESPWEHELQRTRTQHSRSYRSDSDWSRTHSLSPTLSASRFGKREQMVVNPTRGEYYSSSGCSMEVVPDDDRRIMLPKHTDMWSLLPFPTYQSQQPPIEDTFSDLQSVFSNPKPIVENNVEEPRYRLVSESVEKEHDGSFLFVTADNAEKLKKLLNGRGF